MAETYCGKSCGECPRKEELSCPGCMAGPGRPFGGDCELAHCVRNKGHETCETCIFKGNCGTLRNRDQIPFYRIRKNEAEARQKAAIARRAPVLGKWLWLLFWLVVPSFIASMMSHEITVRLAPGLFLPGQILSAVCSLVYGAILIKLGTEEDHYRTAGICLMIAGAIVGALAIISGPEAEAWTLLFTVPAAVIGFYGEYHEYHAHAAVLSVADDGLSAKWDTLWKWYAGLILGLVGCLLVMLLFPLLAALAMLGAAIGLIVCAVLKLVYLYRTAKVFREYPPEV